jgi:small subunit ribosomal protein S13
LARISGVDLPRNKKIEIAITYIFGIGNKIAKDIVLQSKIDADTYVKDLKEDDIVKIREIISNYVVEGDLRRDISQNIRRLRDISCYRGIRHRKNLPVRGQRTHTNARSKRGKKVAVAGKKKVTK